MITFVQLQHNVEIITNIQKKVDLFIEKILINMNVLNNVKIIKFGI